MLVEIFDVGHGACAVVTCPNGNRLMIDCGHHPDRPWKPSNHFYKREIEDLIISNYDEDHVSDLEDLMRDTELHFITRNLSVSYGDLSNLKMENGMGSGINRLHRWMKSVASKPASGRSPDFGAVKRNYYYNDYPVDFTDENNLSVVTILEYNDFKVLFGGDIEEAGWKRLLNNRRFTSELRGINVFVASHHGRVSGCCEEVMEICTPHIVVMSDRDKAFNSQETTDWYARRCVGSGVKHKGRDRKVFTTRNDGDISIQVSATNWSIQTSR